MVRVYSRPIGVIDQELAGVGLTLVAYADSTQRHLGILVAGEMTRVEKMDKSILREKHHAKVLDGVGLAPHLPIYEDPKLGKL